MCTSPIAPPRLPESRYTDKKEEDHSNLIIITSPPASPRVLLSLQQHEDSKWMNENPINYIAHMSENTI